MSVVDSVFAWMRDSSNASLAAWAQAVGSILAVIAAFAFPTLQSRRDAKMQAAERRGVRLAHAAALRVIAVDSEDAIQGLVGTIKLEPGEPPPVHGFPLPSHPQLAIFSDAMAELLPRISGLMQQPALDEPQIEALVAIRGCLKDARVLFDGVNSPYREFDSKKKDRAYATLSRVQVLRDATQSAYMALAARR